MSETKLQFVTTDVFTQTRYEGNPLAIVRLPAAYSINQSQKQRIAREFNLSETVILHENEESYRTSQWTFDIFLTNIEVPFAGHPTIGTICYLGQTQRRSLKGSLKCKAGLIAFTYDLETNSAAADIPHDHYVHAPEVSPSDAEATGLASEVAKSMVRPGKFVSIVKGMTFCFIELSSLEALGGVDSKVGRFDTAGCNQEYTEGGVAGAMLAYCLGKEGGDVTTARTRLIIDGFEDAATGSASCALAIYLAIYHESATGKKNQSFEFTQGVEMGRKSVIGVQITLDDSGKKVEKVVLSGSAVDVSEGNLVVPP